MPRPYRDFTNQKIGHLTILHIDESKPRGSGKNIFWICQCNCGNLISVNSTNLNSGIKNKRNMSCGKCHAQSRDLTNQKFGMLTALQIDENFPATAENDWKIKWLCQCDCGNKISVYASNLTRLHTSSCGCINRSIGESNIEKILQNNNIQYAKEYTFSDLRNEKPLRFDFAVFDKNNNLIELVEFDGRQHHEDYTPWKTNETLKERQLRDEIKNKYCEQHKIKLIRIPYTQRDNITLQLLELEEYIS